MEVACGRSAGKLAIRETCQERLVCGGGCIDGAVWDAGRDGEPSGLSLQATLKGIHVRWIRRHQVRYAAGQDVTEHSEARADHALGFELPGERGAGLPLDCGSCWKQVVEPGVNDCVERLVGIVGGAFEGAVQPRDQMWGLCGLELWAARRPMVQVRVELSLMVSSAKRSRFK